MEHAPNFAAGARWEFGWRCCRANLNGGLAFVVDYVVCPHCSIGWVDKPHTIERYQRRGLAAAALRALRIEHAGVVWHTGSGHAIVQVVLGGGG